MHAYGYSPLAVEGAHLLHPNAHYGHGYYGHGHQPSRLGPSRSVSRASLCVMLLDADLLQTSSSTPSPSSSAQTSAHPSPRVDVSGAPPLPPVIDPLPPAAVTEVETAHTPASAKDAAKPVRPPVLPLHSGASAHGHESAGPEGHEARAGSAAAATPSGSSTPRAKFLQTLQSKSAWDALIHGSFS